MIVAHLPGRSLSPALAVIKIPGAAVGARDRYGVARAIFESMAALLAVAILPLTRRR